MPIVDIIKNDNSLLNEGMGSKSVLAWKYLHEDFNNGSTLIVNEAEEAVFFSDGIGTQVFSGGRYMLDTGNNAFINPFRRVFTGGVNGFSAKVYFVNLDHKLALNWGTASPILVRDPKLKLQTSVRARGTYSAQVVDSKKFVVKLVGNNIQLFTQEEFNRYFRSAFLQYITDAIQQYIVGSGREVLEVIGRKSELAESIQPLLEQKLDDYGVRLVDFYIESVDIPENDPIRQQYEQGNVDVAVLETQGENWSRLQSAKILSDLANNPGAGGIAAAGAAVGFGAAAGGVFSGMANAMFQPTGQPGGLADPNAVGRSRGSRFDAPAAAAPLPSTHTCAHCGDQVPDDSRFCAGCGTPQPQAATCPQCGTVAAPGAAFCSHCGTSIG